MDKTKVFVSSTCYDLSQIRRDIEGFIKKMGYIPVMSDAKDISIPPGLNNIEACKWLVRSSDIFVLIIGGRYGSTDKETGKSITNIEYDTAFDAEMPLYIFVDKEVWIKRETFSNLNQMFLAGELSPEKLTHALGGKIQDIRVFDFINNLEGSHRDQWIHHFEQASEIEDILKKNWSLLLKELITARRKDKSMTSTERLAPKLMLKWMDSNDKPSDRLVVSPCEKPNKSTVISNLEKLLPSQQDLETIDNHAKNIEKLISERDLDEIGLSKYPEDISKFLNSASNFCEKVNGIIKTIESENENDFMFHYNSKNRKIVPYFQIENTGTCPAENIVIYVKPTDKFIFIKGSELRQRYYTIPTEVPSSVRELIELAYQAKSLMNEEKHRQLGIEVTLNDVIAPHMAARLKGSGLSMGRASDLFRSRTSDYDYKIMLPDYTSMINFLHETNRVEFFSIKNGQLRITLDCKLKHNFTKQIDVNTGIYMIPILEKGEFAKIQYECHADNLPKPSTGELTIIAE